MDHTTKKLINKMIWNAVDLELTNRHVPSEHAEGAAYGSLLTLSLATDSDIGSMREFIIELANVQERIEK